MGSNGHGMKKKVCIAPAQRAAGGCSPLKVIPDREPAAGEKNFRIGLELVLNGSGTVLNGFGTVRMDPNGCSCVIIFI